jgi:hypothetical protein
MNIITQKLFTRSNDRLRPVTEARIATCSHVVDQPGLSRQHLGHNAFAAAISRRRAWIKENCTGDHHGEPVRDSDGVITGRRFQFSDGDDAFHFGLRF